MFLYEFLSTFFKSFPRHVFTIRENRIFSEKEIFCFENYRWARIFCFRWRKTQFSAAWTKLWLEKLLSMNSSLAEYFENIYGRGLSYKKSKWLWFSWSFIPWLYPVNNLTYCFDFFFIHSYENICVSQELFCGWSLNK